MEAPPDPHPTPSVCDWSVAPASGIRPCFPTLRPLFLPLSFSLSLSLSLLPLFSPLFYFSLFLPTSHDPLHHGIEVRAGLGRATRVSKRGNAGITESEGGKVCVCVCVCVCGRGELFRWPADEERKRKREKEREMGDGERLR